MARVQTDNGPLPERRALRVRGAPVRYVGVVEGRLEKLVLQHQPLIGTDPLIDLRKAVGKPVLAAPDVTLAGVVGAIGQARSSGPATRFGS